jgi:hypothetical protein
MWAQVSFPEQSGERPDQEVVEVAFDDGRRERLRIQDYARVFAVPGLYEEVVQRRLDCRAPKQVATMLARAAGARAGELRVLDVGAGNGVSGEALAAAGLRPVAAIDLEPTARDAALRDRPGLYELYLCANLLAVRDDESAAIRALAPNALTCVGAMGGGHLPARAVAAAMDLLEPHALVALTLHPIAGRDEPEVRALEALLEERLRDVVRERYRHRLTAAGRERYAEAMVGRLAA